MSLRLKNRDKFTGKLGEDLTEHIRNSIEAAQDYKLDQGNKLAFFHNIFDGETKRFYREKVKTDAELSGKLVKSCKMSIIALLNRIGYENIFKAYGSDL